ncbi:MAG TPA: DNA-binding protein [Gammaproteobacteria bacterium]|nr:DNA-binding protein [Gammaproteobacteria bacterium]
MQVNLDRDTYKKDGNPIIYPLFGDSCRTGFECSYRRIFQVNTHGFKPMTWLSIDQLSEIFGVSKKTLQNRISSGAPMPPSYPVGRNRLFKQAEVDEWIEQQRVETSLDKIID